MQKLGMLGIIVMLGMMCVSSAYSTSMTVEPVVAENADTTLTVVFDAPPEFDPVPAPKPVMTRKVIAPAISTENVLKSTSDNVAVVPEPSTLILLGMGLLGMLGLARKKRK